MFFCGIFFVFLVNLFGILGGIIGEFPVFFSVFLVYIGVFNGFFLGYCLGILTFLWYINVLWGIFFVKVFCWLFKGNIFLQCIFWLFVVIFLYIIVRFVLFCTF